MVSDISVELPFFPKYETECLYEDKLCVTWFEPNFSQSHYNIQNVNKGSNACTLIAILIAAKCNQYKVTMNNPEKCISIKLIVILAESMLEGNSIHDSLKVSNQLPHINLTIPEALKFAERDAEITEWKSEVFMEPLAFTLHENITKSWIEWTKFHFESGVSNLYVTLVADSRTVLFIIQMRSETITLVDSHQHSSDKGAFIAVVHFSKLKYLCQFYNEALLKFHNSVPQLYELSFLYSKVQ
ncbi:uncharacterized protein [Leptinotarsa decemlineata]|uniref:uncharacterized protein n=1 Tax=Leptinotarsa decemlineata TaxID=7539 RepID=UPI000C2559D8|nr:uncharacterized protein LOC111503886 [Leptinotarsa decemlineata]